MADQKISQLTTLIGADAATNDLIPVVDVSTGTTKKMTRAEFFQNTPLIDKGVFGDSTTKYNAITINGGHVGDGGNDYGLTISSFEPAITLIDRTSGAGSTQLFGTNSGGLWLVGDTLNDGTIGHDANITDFLVAKFEPINTIFYTSGAESMRINSSGNVGIGTSSPTRTLSVGANSNGLYSDEDGFYLVQETSTGDVLSLRSYGFVDYRSDDANVTASTGHRFYTDNAERMRIDSSGNVGIGDTTPDVALDVVGDINYTGTITDVSDRRLKENVQDLSDSLDKICQLDAKSYTLIADRGNESIAVELGFIAQEVQPVFPEIVKEVQKFAVDENGQETTEEVNYLGVSYIQLIAPMVEAIKELKLKNDALEARIVTLGG